ncbi:hypothetical protein [Microvirga massiliensis]|uniref:hypothetical protein n=1 Tax=Microvirga massiliensis TaxID=1033741 RepID=UPI00062B717C|nr:hypothetical protein [Microvirga massiliensis]
MNTALPRAGRLDCLCEPAVPVESTWARPGVGRLALGFAFSIVAQVLTLSILPLAGLQLAPSSGWATLPLAAFYAGAASASLPASFLCDAFGRRAALSLGAALGSAGGIILAFALETQNFAALLLGGFWLGIAGGFSLFYRHAAVPLGGRGLGTIALVFGAGALAGLAAPSIIAVAEALAAPRVFTGAALAAALAHIGSLVAAASLPLPRQSHVEEEAQPRLQWRPFAWATIAAGSSWLLMSALMGAAPIAMVGCGLGGAVSGVIAWHVVAMYAPALPLAAFGARARPVPVLVFGAAMTVAGFLPFAKGMTEAAFAIAAVLFGAGWSLVTVAATGLLHQSRAPRWLLGLHDAIILAAALFGAAAAGILA